MHTDKDLMSRLFSINLVNFPNHLLILLKPIEKDSVKESSKDSLRNLKTRESILFLHIPQQGCWSSGLAYSFMAESTFLPLNMRGKVSIIE